MLYIAIFKELCQTTSWESKTEKNEGSSERMSKPYQLFCYHYLVINKMFFSFSLPFFPTSLSSLHLNLILSLFFNEKLNQQ